MAPSADVERQVRDALAHLYDLPYLQTHPLARLVGGAGVPDPALGRTLHARLLALLDGLRVRTSEAGAARSARGHRLLVLRYVEGLDAGAAAARLGIGKSEYYREHRRAVQAVASLLEESARPVPLARASAASDGPPARLPSFLTGLVGRRDETKRVGELLGAARLVTLTGPPGTGKTRLAVEVASRWPASDGVFFVPLAAVAEPRLVLPTVAAALELGEAPGQTPAQALRDHLRESAALLVLDNVEQVVEAGPDVAELVAACRRLRVLVTSRAALRVQGERTFEVQPLGLPDPAGGPTAEVALRAEAVQLFVERTRDAAPDFALTDASAPAVAAICRRLDGLPLAIELAARRVKLLEPAALLARFDAFTAGEGPRLALLTSGARDLPARQRTLRNALAWSYDLLGPDERARFRRLAVFVGGFSLEAAAAIAGAGIDDVGSLVEQSLLQRVEGAGAESRFTMVETVREYGLELLAAHRELAELRREHAAHFLAAVQPRPTDAAGFDWREREHGNLRAALAWFVEQGDAEGALTLVAGLTGFWAIRGYTTEGRASIERVLALPGASAPTPRRANAFGVAGRLAVNQGDYGAADRYYQACIAAWRALGNFSRVSAILSMVANLSRERGELALARAQMEEGLALARGLEGEDRLVCTRRALSALGMIALQAGDYRAARGCFEEARTLPSESPHSAFGDVLLVIRLGYADHAEGDLASARARFEEALAFMRSFGDRRAVANVLANLGLVVVDQGAADPARAALDEALATAADLGDRAGTALALEGFAGLAAARGAAERALRLAGAAAALRERVGAPAPPSVVEWLGRRLAAARAGLDERAAATAWEEGRALPTERMVADARRPG